jgi:hypothetical protein
MSKTYSEKATAILWLSDMKEQGKKRLLKLAQEHAQGKLSYYEMTKARQKYEAIVTLLRLISNCPVELSELEEIIKGIEPGVKQARMQLNPKNPL